MTTNNTLPVYAQLILSLLTNNDFPLFKAFCLNYNKDHHINWDLQWDDNILKQYLLKKFPHFTNEIIQFYQEKSIPFILEYTHNAQALIEKEQRKILIDIIIEQQQINQELTLFLLNNLSLTEILICEKEGIDFYNYNIYPYLHINGDDKKFDYFIQNKKINYHFSFFTNLFQLYQQHEEYRKKSYYNQANIFSYSINNIVDKITHYDLFKNDCFEISYFSSFDELEQFIYDNKNIYSSSDELVLHVAKHNTYKPEIVSKENLAKLINSFDSHYIEPFFNALLENQNFETVFEYIKYLTTQPNNTYSFYFMYKNRNIRIIKNLNQEEKENIVKLIMEHFTPKEEGKRYIGLNNEYMQKFIINVINSQTFKNSDFSEQILSMINKYKLKENNYDDTSLIYELFKFYSSKFSKLDDDNKNILQELTCTRHINGSIHIIEKIITNNKNNPDVINKKILFVKNFCATHLPAIYDNLFGENNNSLSRITDPQSQSIFEKTLISLQVHHTNDDQATKNKRL